ncbi:MAG: HlyD family efflux transporter periplasmic adaptor subunit [Pirellulaceae bacterium]|nr:HlyD family efflux transporter periplasmic adaptor subunit [Pirellulaceae bacterium]
MKTWTSPSDRVSFPRSGISAAVLMIAVLAVLLLGGGAVYMWNGSGDSLVNVPTVFASVTKGEFVSQVLDQGEIQSSENIEIRCQVQARNGTVNVLQVVPEGTKVKAGDFLVRLDSTSFEKELEQQRVSVANAQTTVIQNDAALKAAQASLKEYEEGLFVQQQKTIQNELFDAESSKQSALQELEQAKEVLTFTTRLVDKGFQTKQGLEADKFAVERAKTNLERAENSIKLAEKKLEVLENITREKEMVLLLSEIEAAKVRLDNGREALRVEEDKLKGILQQIENCTVRVPPGVEGQVVYGKESSRGGTEWVLEEGASVRENQVLMRLPNPEKMEVKALIHEQSITLIRPGMPATIRVDALNNQILKGVVTKVNQYAESSGWMSTSVRKYAVLVKIVSPPSELKPGMNASVTIQSLYQPEALQVPVQCVYGVQDQHFCLVKKGDNKWETREIKIGANNSQYVWIKEGVELGEEMAMNPGAYKHLMDLPEVARESRIELPEGVAAEAQNLQNQKTEGASQALVGAGEPGGTRPSGPEGGRGGPGGPGGGAGGQGGNRSMNPQDIMNRTLERLDANGDGKLQTSEWNSADNRMASFIDNPDLDNNGEITVDELGKAMEAMRARMGSGGGPPGGGPPGGGGSN